MHYNPAKRSEKQTVTTHDGSTTLYSAEFDECYHSTRDGALHESLTKHVIPALTLQQNKETLTILDICYGLGYNTLATLYYLDKHHPDKQVHILSPEFDEALVQSLRDFDYPAEFDPLRPIIEAISKQGYYADSRWHIDIFFGDARDFLRQIQTPDSTHSKLDVVYQDAFSPAKNPLLWTREWFADIRTACAEDAVLTTYSVAASTRMGLHENGFELYEYHPEETRKSLIASPSPLSTSSSLLPSPSKIDMELKIARNPNARSLRDADFDK
jgi:tRNA U34 5-methylaminomethyl-2-thiouridine-forming methyltransferase MnmC